jgi:hypothetical protein
MSPQSPLNKITPISTRMKFYHTSQQARKSELITKKIPKLRKINFDKQYLLASTFWFA